MMGMMGSGPPSAVTSDQLSILRSLAVLVDPAAAPQIARLAASLPREDVARALTGLHELLATITALSPIESAIAEAITDLEEREAVLASREVQLRKREVAIGRAIANLETAL
jgi:hypothetical protein